MEQGVKWAIRFVVGIFCLLTVWTSYWAVLAGPTLAVHPRNARLQLIDAQVVRGSIYTRDGFVIADSVAPRVRKYTTSPALISLAPTIGYVHPRFGKSGLEQAWDQELLGMVDETSLFRFWARLVGKSWDGWDIITTLEASLQEAVFHAMEGRPGAVVVMDPRDGAIRAIYSAPGFHPDDIDTLFLEDEDDRSVFNRVTLGQYPPGSVFKAVVLAAALESGTIRPDHVSYDEGTISIGGRNITNAGGKAFGTLGLDDALAVSSNPVFAQLAVMIGASQLTSYAEQLGFGKKPEMRIPTASGRLPDVGSLSDPVALAALGIGQGQLLVSPLQIAAAFSIIANGGWQVSPHLVDRLRSPTGMLKPVTPASATRKMTPGTAHIVREAMIAGVERGTAMAAQVPGLDVAGKTGTAQVAHGSPHAWFAGFVPARSPRYVVVVVVEHGGAGGTVAAPVAQKIFAHITELL